MFLNNRPPHPQKGNPAAEPLAMFPLGDSISRLGLDSPFCKCCPTTKIVIGPFSTRTPVNRATPQTGCALPDGGHRFFIGVAGKSNGHSPPLGCGDS